MGWLTCKQKSAHHCVNKIRKKLDFKNGLEFLQGENWYILLGENWYIFFRLKDYPWLCWEFVCCEWVWESNLMY